MLLTCPVTLLALIRLLKTLFEIKKSRIAGRISGWWFWLPVAISNCVLGCCWVLSEPKENGGWKWLMRNRIVVVVVIAFPITKLQIVDKFQWWCNSNDISIFWIYLGGDKFIGLLLSSCNLISAYWGLLIISHSIICKHNPSQSDGYGEIDSDCGFMCWATLIRKIPRGYGENTKGLWPICGGQRHRL